MAENRRLFPTPEPVRNAQLEWIEPMLGELLAADFPPPIRAILTSCLVDWYVNELDDYARRDLLAAWVEYREQNC
jgi:hypothetical protein